MADGRGDGAHRANPNVPTIGIAAPLLLVTCRFAQGLSWGEITGSTTFTLEFAPKGKRGRWVGVVYFFGNIRNSFVALMLIALQLLISQEAYLDWGWRIPFLAGGLIGFVGYWLRRNLDEPEEYKQTARATKGKNPLRSVTRSGWKSMLYVAMILPVQAGSAILLLGFMYTFLVKQVGLDFATGIVVQRCCNSAVCRFPRDWRHSGRPLWPQERNDCRRDLDCCFRICIGMVCFAWYLARRDHRSSADRDRQRPLWWRVPRYCSRGLPYLSSGRLAMLWPIS